jgi:hypothetical protein
MAERERKRQEEVLVAADYKRIVIASRTQRFMEANCWICHSPT